MIDPDKESSDSYLYQLMIVWDRSFTETYAGIETNYRRVSTDID